MAKKAKPAAAKPTTEKPAKTKPIAAAKPAKDPAKPTKDPVKPAKALAKAAKPAAQAPAAPKASKPKVVVTPVAPLPLGTAPAAVPPLLSDRYNSFEDAKNATIDTLLASIEAAEARLLEVKRAASFEQLEPLANGSGELHS